MFPGGMPEDNPRLHTQIFLDCHKQKYNRNVKPSSKPLYFESNILNKHFITKYIKIFECIVLQSAGNGLV